MGTLIGTIPLTQSERVARYHATPKGRLTNLMCNIRQRSKVYGHEVTVTKDDLVDIYNLQNGKCALTGVEFNLSVRNGNTVNPDSMSIDRIDTSKGYIHGNVRIITSMANTAKGRWTDEQLIQFCKQVVEHNG